MPAAPAHLGPGKTMALMRCLQLQQWLQHLQCRTRHRAAATLQRPRLQHLKRQHPRLHLCLHPRWFRYRRQSGHLHWDRFPSAQQLLLQPAVHIRLTHRRSLQFRSTHQWLRPRQLYQQPQQKCLGLVK